MEVFNNTWKIEVKCGHHFCLQCAIKLLPHGKNEINCDECKFPMKIKHKNLI